MPPHPLEAQNQQRRYRFLPADKIEAVIRLDRDYAETFTLQQTITQQARDIQRNAGADQAAATTQIAALLNDANRQLTRLLGAEGADAYRKTGGTWLRTLETSAARSGSPAARPTPRPTGGR